MYVNYLIEKITYFLKCISSNVIIILSRFLYFLWWSSCMTHFLFKNTLVFFQYFLYKCVLSNTRWSYNNKWLSSWWCRVEWVEIFFGIYKNIILEKDVNMNKSYKIDLNLQVYEEEHYLRNHWGLHEFQDDS